MFAYGREHRMASAIQILCVMAYAGRPATTSEVIARSLKTNPVVVRRLLKSMQHAGLVEMRPGKDGGVQLGREPGQITLDQVYKAVESDGGVFALRPRGNPRCPVDTTMKHLLGPIFRSADAAVEQTLGRTTIASLVATIV